VTGDFWLQKRQNKNIQKFLFKCKQKLLKMTAIYAIYFEGEGFVALLAASYSIQNMK